MDIRHHLSRHLCPYSVEPRSHGSKNGSNHLPQQYAFQFTRFTGLPSCQQQKQTVGLSQDSINWVNHQLLKCNIIMLRHFHQEVDSALFLLRYICINFPSLTKMFLMKSLSLLGFLLL